MLNCLIFIPKDFKYSVPFFSFFLCVLIWIIYIITHFGDKSIIFILKIHKNTKINENYVLCLWLGANNTKKVSVHPKLIYKYKAILIKEIKSNFLWLDKLKTKIQIKMQWANKVKRVLRRIWSWNTPHQISSYVKEL